MILQLNISQVIHSFSDALDLVGIDEVQHGKRVAFMACECGSAVDLAPDLMKTLYHAALLHDCGVSSTQIHRNLVTELDWSGSQEHCLRGESLLQRCSLLSELSPIIRYHHTHWRDLPPSLDPDTALLSNLIFLTDRVDALIAQHDRIDILRIRHDILQTIEQYQGDLFAPELTVCFLKTAASEYFWLMLEPRHLTRYIMEQEQDSAPQDVDRSTFLEIALLFAEIVDAKSAFTVEHSLGVARLAKFIGRLAGLSEEKQFLLGLTGLLHDLGKLNVPDEILEKAGPLTVDERLLMMRHSFESYQILRRISGFEEIANWAAFHHESLAGTGYPFHKDETGLGLEARIIAVADVFQALTQNRPYRPQLPLEEIFFIMDKMTAEGALDPELVALTKAHADACRLRAECLD